MYNVEIMRQAAERWSANARGRRRNQTRLDKGEIADTPERLQKRLQHLESAAVLGARFRGADPTQARPAPGTGLVESLGLERIIGTDDRLGMDFIEMAMAVSRTVARVHLRRPSGSTRGFGTGFLVSPRLCLTNHHVLESPVEAQHSELEFDYQLDRNRHLLPVRAFKLQPDVFFLNDEELDYALVAVQDESVDGTAMLSDYGWNQLIGSLGKALVGDHLNIIQHPGGEPKQLVLRENELVQLLDDFAHYVADTMRGSSGSPVYNDQWEVVALHHSGVPRMRNGQFIAHDGSVWTPGMDPALLDWVANEGIRVSSLVDHISRANLSPDESELRRQLLDAVPPNPVEKAIDAMRGSELPTRPEPVRGTGVDGHTFTIPLHVTVSLGESGAAAVALADASGPRSPAAGTAAPADLTAAAAASVDEAVTIDPDYANRQGFDSAFLGHGHTVRLPWLDDDTYRHVAYNRWATGSNRHVLPYHHFSVIMNRVRKLAFVTAVNIDGNQHQGTRRERDSWHLDPRIPREEQAENDVYLSNPLDRGHLVRRLDPAWGATATIAKFANDDTFHWTNCSPQHEGFNRNRSTWGGVENYILDNAIAQDLRATVFTGPVFRDDDPQYRSIRLPRQYWKVVVIVKEDGDLSATGYLLSQAGLVDDMLEEDFAYGAYKTFQVPVTEVEALAGMTFGDLSDADPLADAALEGLETFQSGVITSFEDIRF